MAKVGGAPLSVITANGELEVCTIFVHTNIDPKFQWQFPKKFYKIPEMGDYVKALDGDCEPLLKVCMRTFLMDGDISIELTGTYRSHS
jgi:hypothetical protein